MFGRKARFLAVVAATMLVFGGCGTDSGNGGNSMGGGNQSSQNSQSGQNGDNAGGNRGNNGGDVIAGGDNLERNTYGMRTDGYAENGTSGGTLGDDMRNAWDNVKNDVKNMGNGTNGNNDNMNHGTAKNK